MEGKIEKSHKKYMEYDPNVWVGEFFDDKTGGYVVVNRDRWVKAAKYKNEGGKYKDEFAVARVFASNGYAMEMLKEVSGTSSPDVTINGVPAEIKCVKSAANMVRYARKATKRQGARIVLFEIQKRTDRVQCEFKILTKLKIHGMYFVSGNKQIYTF